MHDLLDSWATIFATGIFGATAISAFYSGSKIQAVWFGFLAITFLLFLGALQLDRMIRDSAQADDQRVKDAKASSARSSDERPLLVFESVAANPQEWRMGLNSFKWSFRFHNYGKHAAKIISIRVFATISDSVPTADGTPRGMTVYSPSPFVNTLDVGALPIVAPGAQTQEFVTLGDHAPLKMDDQLPNDIREQRQHNYLFSVKPDNGVPTIDGDGIHFWLIGRVEYKDIFEDKTHTTQFGVYLTNPFHTLAEYPDPKYNFQD